VRELLTDQSIFIGVKVDNHLREKLASLDDANKKYVSTASGGFLRICGIGNDLYVGKLVEDKLTTDRIEDIRRNVLSIIRKVGHEIRLQTQLQLFVCSSVDSETLPTEVSAVK
jgi:hypothetical protein